MTAANAPADTVDAPTRRLDATTAASLVDGPGGRPRPGIAHLGLGAFHRAHQLWYTALVDDEGRWGVVAFTGRSPRAASTVREQNGYYTLVERGGTGETYRVLSHLVAAHDGADLETWGALLARDEVAIVTMTVTEAGYHLDATGSLDLNDPRVAADLAVWAEWSPEAKGSPSLRTAVGRLAYGLERRRRAGGTGIAVVSCDNIPDNGEVTRGVVSTFAERADAELADWIATRVSFVSTVVDRITPAVTEDDLAAVESATGYRDEAAVVTEPFSEWILAGEFPAGRPRWEDAGARFVADVGPFERRKLWLLNGAHTLLATVGRLGGHATVAQAIADPRLRRFVDEYWDAVSAVLTDEGLDLPLYRGALLERFGNARIEHRLDQIAGQTVTKLRVRTVPVITAAAAAGDVPVALLRPLAGWIRGVLSGLADADAHVIAVQRARDDADPVAALLAVIDPALAGNGDLLARVRSLVDDIAESLTVREEMEQK